MKNIFAFIFQVLIYTQILQVVKVHWCGAKIEIKEIKKRMKIKRNFNTST